jgi:hypothetical protein
MPGLAEFVFEIAKDVAALLFQVREGRKEGCVAKSEGYGR